MTMPRRPTRRGRDPAGRSTRACRISSRTVRASNWANAAPTQRRTPPPNGSHPPAGGRVLRKRSTRQVVGAVVDVRAAVDEQAAGGERRARRQLPAGDRQRASAQPPQAAQRYRRMQAQRLGDRRLGQPRLSVGQPRLRLGATRHLGERPAQRRGGRLVARRRAASAARREARGPSALRHPRRALAAAATGCRVRSARSDAARRRAISSTSAPSTSAIRRWKAPSPIRRSGPRKANTSARRGSVVHVTRRRRIAPSRSSRGPSSTPNTARSTTRSVIACMRGSVGTGVAQGPGRELAPCRVADQLVVRAHALAVERRQYELAAAQVLVAVEQQEVARAQQRSQRLIRHARVDLDPARARRARAPRRDAPG